MINLLDFTENTYVLASGTSFYSRVLPPASVDFAFSGTAFHWQKLPLPQPMNATEEELAAQYLYDFSIQAFSNNFPIGFLSISHSRAAWTLPPGPYRDRFQAHAIDGWREVVRHRASEMVPLTLFQFHSFITANNTETQCSWGVPHDVCTSAPHHRVCQDSLTHPPPTRSEGTLLNLLFPSFQTNL